MSVLASVGVYSSEGDDLAQRQLPGDARGHPAGGFSKPSEEERIEYLLTRIQKEKKAMKDKKDNKERRGEVMRGDRRSGDGIRR